MKVHDTREVDQGDLLFWMDFPLWAELRVGDTQVVILDPKGYFGVGNLDDNLVSSMNGRGHYLPAEEWL